MISYFGFIILALDIWAIIQIVNGFGKRDRKILWVVLIVLLPVLGLLLWLLFGRKEALSL
jgi:Phospholipase_D-nuclease N-terminal